MGRGSPRGIVGRTSDHAGIKTILFYLFSDQTMGIISKIGWTHATHNFWKGCHKVSEACKFCYADRDFHRWGLGDFRNVTRCQGFNDPLRWHRRPEKYGAFDGMRIFTCSWSDFFIEAADQWRAEAWEVIRQTPNFNWLILTKRPELVMDRLPEDWNGGWSNVWLGYSVENQHRWEQRKEFIREIPAKIKFLSIEPMLGDIYFGEHPGVDWIIYGGESGNNTGKFSYRPTEWEWLEGSVQESMYYQIPVFVKQYGVDLTMELKEVLPTHAAVLNREGSNIPDFRKRLEERYSGTIRYELLTAQEYPKGIVIENS